MRDLMALLRRCDPEVMPREALGLAMFWTGIVGFLVVSG